MSREVIEARERARFGNDGAEQKADVTRAPVEIPQGLLAPSASLVTVISTLDEQSQLGAPPWVLAFALARHCRLELPGLDGIDALGALGRLTELELPWWRLLGFRCTDDAEERVLDAWARVRFVGGTFEEAVRHGLVHPATLPRRLSRPRGLAAFVSTLAYLQRLSSPRPVVLSQSAFASAFHVDQGTASRWTARLRGEEVLQCERDYWHPKKPEAAHEDSRRRRAASYWVDLARVEMLELEASRELGSADTATTGSRP